MILLSCFTKQPSVWDPAGLIHSHSSYILYTFALKRLVFLIGEWNIAASFIHSPAFMTSMITVFVWVMSAYNPPSKFVYKTKCEDLSSLPTPRTHTVTDLILCSCSRGHISYIIFGTRCGHSAVILISLILQ